MKTSDISQTPLVRRYGVRGAKLFARIWFPFMYAMLIGVSTGVWLAHMELMTAGRLQILFGCTIVTLIALAASLLTRMWIDYRAAIERLESEGNMA